LYGESLYGRDLYGEVCPGVPELLSALGRTRYWDLKDKEEDETNVNDKGKGNADNKAPHRVHIALATSSLQHRPLRSCCYTAWWKMVEGGKVEDGEVLQTVGTA
jgi:hypothetical protein